MTQRGSSWSSIAWFVVAIVVVAVGWSNQSKEKAEQDFLRAQAANAEAEALKVSGRADDLESQVSDLEDRISNLESRLDE